MTRTTSLGDFFCPICGKIGQLKFRNGREKGRGKWFEIHHYKDKKGRIRSRIPLHRMTSRYAYFCYLGTVVVQGVYEILYPQPTLFAVAVGRHFL